MIPTCRADDWGWEEQKLIHVPIRERTAFIQNCILSHSLYAFSFLPMSPLAFETSDGVHPCHPLTLLYVKQDHFRPGNMSVSRVKSQFQGLKLKTQRKCSIPSVRKNSISLKLAFPYFIPALSLNRLDRKIIWMCHVLSSRANKLMV